MYQSYYGNSSADSGFSIFLSLVVLAISLLSFIAWCKMFRKAGLPWERMFVPVYGNYWMYGIANCGKLFWVNFVVFIAYSCLIGAVSYRTVSTLTLLFVLCELTIHIIYCRKIAKAFGKGFGFTIGLVLLHPIFIIILGFGSAVYMKSANDDEAEVAS